MATYVADIETFANCFTICALNVETKEWKEFVIHPKKNQSKAFLSWLKNDGSGKPVAFIGYNWVNFDGPIVEHIYRNRLGSATKIYKFAQEIIDSNYFNTKYKEWDLSFRCLDLMKIWHFDRKKVSLKQLEFFFRRKKIADLPFDHTTKVDVSKIPEIIKYNRVDVEETYKLYELSKEKITDRKETVNITRSFLTINKSDTGMASELLLRRMAKRVGMKPADLKKRQTFYDELKVEECLLDFYDFKTEAAKSVYDTYKNFTLKGKGGHIVLKDVLKGKVDYYGSSFDYGFGGAHLCTKPGIYESDDEWIIIDDDVKSYYPNEAIQNRFFPKHLSEAFCDVYAPIYEERKQYPKDKFPSKNRSLKLQLNSVVGLSKEKHSWLKDEGFFIKITVNGQLSLLMLADWVYDEIPEAHMLQLNTDGVTFRIKRKYLEKYRSIIRRFEETTKLQMEEAIYKKMVISDVNSYIAFYDGSDKVKRKGRYCIYSDLLKDEDYSKNPSALIIPKAVYMYHAYGTPVEQTVMAEQNIHEFLIGVKKTKAFDFRLWYIKNGIPRPTKPIKDRFIRYYISTQGGSLYKHWTDGRVTGLNVDDKVVVAQSLKSNRAELFRDLDYEYYIKKAKELIRETEHE